MTCGGCSKAVERALSKVEGTWGRCDGGETGVDARRDRIHSES